MNAIASGRLDKEAVRSAADGQWIDRILPSGGFDRDDLDGRHHSCPKCGGTDRFRVIEERAGAVMCNQCFNEDNGDGFAALMWRHNWTFPEALQAVADILGISGSHYHENEDRDIVEHMARLKRIPLASFLAFGAHKAKRGKLTVARVPMYDENRVKCSEFDLSDNSPEFEKGMSAKKSPENPGVGLFVADWPKPDVPSLIAEGVKDSGALHSLGFNAVGLPTCKMAPKFARVFAGCHVVIVPDLDKTGIESAHVNASRLYGIAASVRIARLPGEVKATDGDGVREILAKRDGETLVRQAVADAVLWVPTEKDTTSSTLELTGDEVSITADVGAIIGHTEALFQIDDPHRLARLFVLSNMVDGLCRYRRCNETWYYFDSTKYVVVGDEELRATITDFVQHEFEIDAAERLAEYNLSHEDNAKPPKARQVKRNLVVDVLAHLTAQTILPSSTTQPSWIGESPAGFDTRVTVAFRNGILNLWKLTTGQDGFLIPSTPRFFSTNVLPYEFDEQAQTPSHWLRFLNEIWPDDPESIQCLQEWFGLFLTADIRHQKILLMIGPRRSGKGTIGRVIRALIGEQNVAGPTLASLATNFGLWPLIGRQVAIVADARLSKQTDVAVVGERLLQISGEDGVTIDRKNLQPLHVTLPTRFVLMTNELPRLTDASNAMAGRFVILRMVNSFYGQEDQELTDRLLTELPGILCWAIEGWQRLHENRRFTFPESSQELVTQLEDATSPVGAFVREHCEVGAELEIDKDELFRAWRDWCISEGQTYPGTAATFAIQLRAVVASLGSKRGQVMGVRIQRFTGIGLKTY